MSRKQNTSDHKNHMDHMIYHLVFNSFMTEVPIM